VEERRLFTKMICGRTMEEMCERVNTVTSGRVANVCWVEHEDGFIAGVDVVDCGDGGAELGLGDRGRRFSRRARRK